MSEQIYILCQQYLDEELSESDRFAFETRLKAESDLSETLAEIRRQRAFLAKPGLDFSEGFEERVMQKILTQSPVSRTIYPQLFSAFQRLVLPAAAVVVLFILFSLFSTNTSDLSLDTLAGIGELSQYDLEQAVIVPLHPY
ncbi:MAG: hypothetical protein AAF206_22545 [Bacteroidota bacterium]